MKIYRSIDDFKKLNGVIVSIGTFDGVHLGHQKILKRIAEIASKENSESVLLTFFPHPRMVLHPDDHGLQLLNTLDEKIMLLEKAGIDHLIIHPFSKEFSRNTSTEFVRDYLVNKIGTKVLVIGYDHHFGRNRQGSLEELKELASVYDFMVEEIPAQEVDDIAVSSTKIRKALLEGNLEQANTFLTYPYMLTGSIAKGHSRGKKLGFPTANLKLEENYKLIPASGIYFVEVTLEGSNDKLPALLSIGHNPTFGNNPLTIEVYILDFDRDIYGMKMQVEMIEKLRNEIKFENEAQLISQMKADEVSARELIKRRRNVNA
ncbi:MAG: bifunctional riboflavin kinase/FAD synthetase [Bacteroidia bacterium]|nr:bifunctional riboflavin kinase/FAD synthetase [Bacteroidia bacterium]